MCKSKSGFELAPGFHLDLDLSNLTGFGFDLDLRGCMVDLHTTGLYSSSVAAHQADIMPMIYLARHASVRKQPKLRYTINRYDFTSLLGVVSFYHVTGSEVKPGSKTEAKQT